MGSSSWPHREGHLEHEQVSSWAPLLGAPGVHVGCDQLLCAQGWPWHLGTKELASHLFHLWIKAGLSFLRDALGRWSCSSLPFVRPWCCRTVWLIGGIPSSFLSSLPPSGGCSSTKRPLRLPRKKPLMFDSRVSSQIGASRLGRRRC